MNQLPVYEMDLYHCLVPCTSTCFITHMVVNSASLVCHRTVGHNTTNEWPPWNTENIWLGIPKGHGEGTVLAYTAVAVGG